MDVALGAEMTSEQDRRISEIVERERARLRNFIRRRVADPAGAGREQPVDPGTG